MNIKYIIKGFGILALVLILSNETKAASNLFAVDSIGVENNNGKQVILHRLKAKETYYSLSRTYSVHPKDIISYNNNQVLKIGDVVKIPTNRPFISNNPPVHYTQQASNKNSSSNDNSIQYRVGAGETLYAISKRFQVSVAQIVQKNNLRNEQDIKVGQTINIPQEAPAPAVVERSAEPQETEAVEEKHNTLPANRYGLKQIDEKGVGVWMEGLNADGANMLALHKTAPVGTVVKITNPMTQKTTFAKIVGKYTDNSNTRDAVIVISKSTANLLGILDKRFLINISYGMPVN